MYIFELSVLAIVLGAEDGGGVARQPVVDGLSVPDTSSENALSRRQTQAGPGPRG